ncbi:hypothetical protein ACM64Y_17345 [Novispirillum sp. DQ9]
MQKIGQHVLALMDGLLKGIEHNPAWTVQLTRQPTMHRAKASMTKTT